MDIQSLIQLWSVMKEYVDPAMLIVLIGLWSLGYVLKSTPHIQNWMILYILVAVSIAAAIALLGVNAHAFIQGIIVASIAGWAHQLLKQTAERS